MSALKCGFAQRDITPAARNVYLDGYGFRLSPAEGVRDNIYVKVCSMSCDGSRFALISFDWCGMSPEVYRDIAEHVEQISGLPKEKFALCATHTHAAPACGVLDEVPLSCDYIALAAQRAGEALKEAAETEAAGRFDFSFRGELTYMYNRRGRPPIDRRIRRAAFYDQTGALRGIISSASCHAVINSSMSISADYLSVLTAETESRFPGVVSIFLQGRAADIDPYNPNGLDIEGMISALGHDFADKILDITAGAEPRTEAEADCKIISLYDYFKIPMKPFMTDGEYTAAIKAAMEAYHSQKNEPHKHYALRELNYLRKMYRMKKESFPPQVTVPLQVFAVKNKAVFIMLPFEVLTVTGNAVEKIAAGLGYPREAIYVCSLSNASYGYLAPKEEYAYGGYEVAGAAHWYGVPECCEESETAVIEGVKSLLEKI